jgi:tetratricopeptide (TPR) repeat protein
VQLDPSHTAVYLNKGNTEMRLELYQEAILSYTRSLTYDPSNSEGYQGRAFAYLNLEQYASAVEDFNAAIRIDGLQIVSYKNRAIAYAKMDQPGLALKDLKIYLSKAPDDPEALVMQGELLNAIENFEEAKSSLDRAIRIKPDHIRAYLVRGYTHQHMGHLDRAIADFSNVLMYEVQNENALFNRANLFFDKGEWQKAINDFDHLIIINSAYGEAYLMRAKAKINDEVLTDGCSDLKKARLLGISDAKELIIRYCR